MPIKVNSLFLLENFESPLQKAVSTQSYAQHGLTQHIHGEMQNSFFPFLLT